MNNALTFTLIGADRLSPAVKAALGNVEQLISRAQRMHQAFNSSGGAQGVAQLNQMLQQAGNTAERFLGMILGVFAKVASGATSLAGRIMGSIGGAIESVLNSAGKLGAGIFAMLATAGTAFGALGVHSNRFKEDTLASLSAMLKSKSAAQDLFQWLDKFSDVKPFRADEIVQAGKQLVAFGLDVKRTLPLVTDVAFAMKVPLEQVVSVLARAKMGMFEMREAAVVGLSRQDLQAQGMRFSGAGEAVNRSQLLPATMAALQSRFGGSTAEAGSSFQGVTTTFLSVMSRLARQATEAFFNSFKGGLSKLNEAISSMLQGGQAQGIVQALSVPFELVGKAIEFAAARLPQFVSWLSQIVTRQNVISIIINIAAWVETLAAKVMGFVDAATGGGGLVAVWDAFQKAALWALDQVLRIWNVFVFAVKFFAQNSGQIWGLVVDGINLAIAGFQVLVGLVTVALGIKGVAAVVSFGAAVAQALGGLGKLVGGAARLMGFGGGAAAEAGGTAAAAGGAGGAAVGLAPWLAVLTPKMPGGDPANSPVVHWIAQQLGIQLPGGRSAAAPAPGAGAAPGSPGRIGGNAVPQFDGPLGWLQGVGQGVIGAGGSVLSSGVAQLQQRALGLMDLMQRGIAGGRQAYAEGGLDSLTKEQQARARQLQGFMSGLLGGGPGSGAGSGAQGGPGYVAPSQQQQVSQEDIQRIIETRNAAFDSMIAQAKAMAASPFVGKFISEAQRPFVEAEKAGEEARRIIPVLRQKADDIAKQLTYLNSSDKEYWELKTKQYQLQAEIGDYEQKAAETAVQAANKAQQITLDNAGGKVDLLQAQLKNNPFLAHDSNASRGFKLTQLVPALIEKFKALVGMHPAGESEADRLQRMTQAEGLKGEILEASGVSGGQGVLLEGVMAAQNQINRMVMQYRTGRGLRPVSAGGFDPRTGIIPLFNQKKASQVLGQLDQIQKEAQVHAGQATVNTNGQVVINAAGVSDPRYVGPGQGSGGANVAIINIGGGALQQQIEEALRKTGTFTPQQIAQIALNAVNQAKKLAQ